MIPEALTDQPTYFVPTFHPAFMLRGAQQYHEVVVEDIKRALRVAREGHNFKGRPYYILPNGGGNITVNEAVNYIDACYKQGRAVAIDTENYGVGKRDALDQYSCKLHALGVSFAGTDDAISFLADGSLGQADTTRLLNLCSTVFRDPKIANMFFNMGYDLEVLRRHGLECVGPMYDNLVYHHVSDPELDHDLGFVSQQFLDIAPWKVDYRSVERAGHGTLQQLLIYNALDTLATQWLTPILVNRVADIEQTHIARMEVQLMELAGRMGRYGIPIHEERRQEIAVKLQAKRDAALQYIRQQMKWADFNPRGKKDRQELLYERLGYPVRFYTEKNAEPQTGIKALIEHMDNPIVRALVKFDEYAKQLSTFVVKLPDLVDQYNRLHVHWKSTGTIGSRWSSEQPNFQNWPKWLRAIVQAPPGRVLVGADFSQIEYRIIAARAGCKMLVEAFNDPSRDVHSEVSAEVFGETWAKLDPKSSERKNLRAIAKRVVYARNYRASSKTICDNLKNDPNTPAAVRATLTPGFINKIATEFDRACHEIAEWCEDQHNRANQEEFVEIPPIGRRRYYNVKPVEPTVAANNPTQFAAGDYQNISMLAVDEFLRVHYPNTAHIILTVHDQIVVECNKEDADTIATKMCELMTHQVPGPAGPVALIAEPDIHTNWDKV
jgi:DNA polymerase I